MPDWAISCSSTREMSSLVRNKSRVKSRCDDVALSVVKSSRMTRMATKESRERDWDWSSLRSVFATSNAVLEQLERSGSDQRLVTASQVRPANPVEPFGQAWRVLRPKTVLSHQIFPSGEKGRNLVQNTGIFVKNGKNVVKNTGRNTIW